MDRIKKIKSPSDFFSQYLQFEDYIFKGNRGKNIVEFLFFLASNVLFIHIITYVWEVLSDKPAIIYREYVGYTLTMWNAFSAVIMTKFGDNWLRSFLRVSVIGLSLFLSQGLVVLIYLKFVIESELRALDFIALGLTGFIRVLPFLVAISIIASSNIIFKNLTRISIRIAFFVTPVIWMPDPGLINMEKIHLLHFNPLYFGISDATIVVNTGFTSPPAPNIFIYFLGFLLFVSAVNFGYSKLVECWRSRVYRQPK